jgi:23S rRNA pseudouridine1911/1915/1917 synthase
MKNVTFYKFDIEPENNLRLDQIISSRLPEYSRSTIKNWINAEKILVNGKTCSPKDKISIKSEIEIEVHPNEEIDIIPEDIALNILYEDDDFIIVNKSSGMVTHTAVGNYSGTLQNALLFKYPELKNVPRAGIIHRLDKQTSGLLIIARSLQSHNHLTKQIQNRSITKKYLTITSGILKNVSMIDEKIGRHKINRKKMAVTFSGKESISRLKILRRFDKASLIEVELVTGRTHQIRVHLSFIGHPVLGDKLYGFRKSIFSKNTKLVKFLDLYNGHALHAMSLEFKHPSTKEIFFIESSPPDSFLEIQSLIEKHSYADTN